MSLPKLSARANGSRAGNRSRPDTGAQETDPPQWIREVEESLPVLPESQKQCGMMIYNNCFDNMISELEAENSKVREQGQQKLHDVTVLEKKLKSLEEMANRLNPHILELRGENKTLTEDRDRLQLKAANMAAHVKALQAFKKNCQAFLDCKEDLPDLASPEITPRATPEPEPVENVASAKRLSRKPSERRKVSTAESYCDM